MRRALVLACALLLPACAGELFDAEPTGERDLSGSVRIPLATTSAHGLSYALRDATIELSGAAMVTLTAEGSEDALTTPLPAGHYGLFLRPGFRLVQLDELGREHPVEARLVSANPAPLRVAELDDVTAKLRFEHAGGTIAFGAPGSLQITSAL